MPSARSPMNWTSRTDPTAAPAWGRCRPSSRSPFPGDESDEFVVSPGTEARSVYDLRQEGCAVGRLAARSFPVGYGVAAGLRRTGGTAIRAQQFAAFRQPSAFGSIEVEQAQECLCGEGRTNPGSHMFRDLRQLEGSVAETGVLEVDHPHAGTVPQIVGEVAVPRAENPRDVRPADSFHIRTGQPFKAASMATPTSPSTRERTCGTQARIWAMS